LTCRTDSGANVYGSGLPDRARWSTAISTTYYGHNPYELRPRPLWTRRSIDTEEGEIEVPTPHPHISTSSNVYTLALNHWIGTIRVQIGTGDIVKPHIQAIVNPANSHLNHFGGVARVSADLAGIDLIGECETYKQTHGLLPTAEVINTTAGKLRLQIEYVIHTVGPRDVDYGDKDELQTILTRTYYSVIKYASEILRIPTLCFPAISSGIFQVKLESVVRAFYTALKQYVDEYARTSHTPILQSIRFVSNCIGTTAAVAAHFQELYNIDQPVCTPTNTPIDMPTLTPSGRQAGRQRRANKRVEERMEIWTPDLLCLKQAEDLNINAVIQWLTHDSKPD